jgi:hypothetical protein
MTRRNLLWVKDGRMSILIWHTTTGYILQKLNQKLCLTKIFIGLLWLLRKLNTMHNKVRIINQGGFSSSSLALQPFKFGTCFPHDRCPFCSAQSSSSPTFHTHIPQVLIHPPSSRFSLFSPSPWSFCQLLFSRPCTIHSYNTPTCSNLRTLITEFVINFLNNFYSPNPIFISWSVYFFSFFPS